MDVQAILSQARDAMTVNRVFGQPIEKNGVTIVPVARIMGGGGGGAGSSSGENGGTGGGVGYGLAEEPAGVYVIKGDQVTWQPVINVNRVILGGQIVAVVLILAIRAIVRARHGD